MQALSVPFKWMVGMCTRDLGAQGTWRRNAAISMPIWIIIRKRRNNFYEAEMLSLRSEKVGRGCSATSIPMPGLHNRHEVQPRCFLLSKNAKYTMVILEMSR